MYLTTSRTPEGSIDARRVPDTEPGDTFAVQVFLGESATTLYLTVDEARELGRQLLAVAGDQP